MLSIVVPDRVLIVDDAPEAQATLEAHLKLASSCLARSRDPDLAVLVLSSRPAVADVVRSLQYGAMDYLPKLLDLPGVEAALQRAGTRLCG